MFAKSFHIFAWVILVTICLLLVKSLLNVNEDLILKYFDKNIDDLSDDVVTTILIAVTAVIMLLSRLAFNYIDCPKCHGTGEAVSLDEIIDDDEPDKKEKKKKKKKKKKEEKEEN